MKIDIIKALIVMSASALIGWLCHEIADAENHRDWISFAVSFLSISLCTGSAFACSFRNRYRGVNIKVASWIFSVIVILANIVFSCFTYNIPVYIIVLALLTLLNIASVYALSQTKEH